MQATPPAPTVLAETVRRALSEDIDRGDITTEACVEPTAVGTATLSARERVVVCGLPVLEEVFAQVDLLVDVDSPCAGWRPRRSRNLPRNALRAGHVNPARRTCRTQFPAAAHRGRDHDEGFSSMPCRTAPPRRSQTLARRHRDCGPSSATRFDAVAAITTARTWARPS